MEKHTIQLSKLIINAAYAKEWHITEPEFYMLSKDGKPLRDTLYRIGGMGTPQLSNKYFMLLRYKEAYYPEHILKMSKNKDPKHLQGCWCILTNTGEEKRVFAPFENPHIIKDSCIYGLKEHYYNIETGQFYCQSFTVMESESFLFLDNKFDKHTENRGVLKIQKDNGKIEFFHSIL